MEEEVLACLVKKINFLLLMIKTTFIEESCVDMLTNICLMGKSLIKTMFDQKLTKLSALNQTAGKCSWNVTVEICPLCGSKGKLRESVRCQ